MDNKDIEEINRFLQSIGKADLYAYYDLDFGASSTEIEDTIKKKRRWAQGQQSNPKFKNEALFLIKHNGNISKLLLEENESYRANLRPRTPGPLAALAGMIRAAVEDKVLSPVSEASIYTRGRELGLQDTSIEQELTRILNEEGARREIGNDDLPARASSTDYYMIVGVAPDADLDEILLAHAAKVRLARNLGDKQRASNLLTLLDEALSVLKDPRRKAMYDESRQLIEAASGRSDTTAIFSVAPGSALSRARGEGFDPGSYLDESLVSRLPRPEEHPADIPRKNLDPFADPAAPHESRSTFINEDSALDPFQPGGSLNPINTWKPTASDDPVSSPGVSTNDRLPTHTIDARLAAPPTSPILPSASLPETEPPPALRPIRSSPPPFQTNTPNTVRPRPPRLSIDGQTRYTLENPQNATQIPIRVRNEGTGTMPGRVTTSDAWLVASPTVLNPDAPDQQIIATIHADKIPAGVSIGTLRIQSDHGEWRDITVQVTRNLGHSRPILPFLLLGGGVAILVLLLGLFFWPQGNKGEESILLSLEVIPVADNVILTTSTGTQPLGKGSQFTVTVPTGESPRLHIESQGFATLDQSLNLTTDQKYQKILLEPDYSMDRPPPANRKPTTAHPNVEGATQAAAGQLATCFQGTGRITPRFTTWIAGSSGLVLHVALDKASEGRADQSCVNRVFRGMRFPPFSEEDAVVIVSTVTLEPK